MAPIRRIASVIGAVCVGLTLVATAAEAQRPFATLDPFYVEETARRGFFDGFALQADVAYRGSEPTGTSAAVYPFALSLRLDYALAQQIDVSAIIDASPGLAGSESSTPVRLSWVVVKPYWHHGRTDYAVRLAVDPSSDSGFGFRQTDVAFLSTSDLSPSLQTDFALGLRRARVGFERLEFVGETVRPDFQLSQPEIVRSRASGTEVHLMWGYRFLLDPGGSNVFTTLSGEGMAYTLLSTRAQDSDDAGRPQNGFDSADEGQLRGGVGRLNVGFEYSRPSFQVAPYMSLPLFRWVEFKSESQTWGPRIEHARLGLRVTVR